MNRDTINAMLDSNDYATVADLNDWAVNTVRDYCDAEGLSVTMVLRHEAPRVNMLDLDTYACSPRIGASFDLSRKAKQAAWATIRTREALATMPKPAPKPYRKPEPEAPLTPEQEAEIEAFMVELFGADYATKWQN